MFLIVYGFLSTVCVSYTLPIEDVVRNQYLPRGLTTIEMIKEEGYTAEEYGNVQTSDGYLLTLHRIPHGKDNVARTNKSVVFLMHGLLSSSADWVNMGSDKSIAYQLADAGYDVWMGNARGNIFSRKHIVYKPDNDSAFWQFSWHEIGIIDLPTMIDYVLNITNQKKLYYIGHSQGTTSFFVMGSERPEYNEKIRLMVALAPVAYMSHINNPLLQIAAQNHHMINWMANNFGLYEFLPSSGLMNSIGQQVCNFLNPIKKVCASVLFLFAGWDSDQLDIDKIPIILSNFPAGSSTMQLLHYGQEIESGYFRQYDHGWKKNKIIYGSKSPPEYNTSRITAPVFLIYAKNDRLAAIVDVERLGNELPNAKRHLIEYKKFNHLDFLYAKDCRKMVYNDVLELLGKF